MTCSSRGIRTAALAVVPLILTQPLPGQAKRDPLAGLDTYIEKARTEWAVPGVAVGVVKNDSVVYAKGFGVKEAGKPERVDERTLFAIGSNSKSFTATAVAMLVDQDKLKWDDRATKWLPWFQLYDPYVTREITVRDLLSHRSGLGRRGDALWYGTSYDRDEIIRRVRYLEPNAGFRTQMGYQNIMFLTAGQIVAAASGMSWDDFIKRRIFQPLGMATSNTSVKDLAGQPDVSTPHTIEDGKARPIPWRNIDNIAPAGSINSNVVEMGQYLRFHLGNGTYQGQKLVSSAVLGVTKTPHINTGGVGDSLTHFASYGLAWVLQDYRGKKIAWHNGGIDGMLSEMWTVPEERLGIVVLTNGSPHAMGPAIVMRIIDAYLGAPEKDYSAEGVKQFQQFQAAQAAQQKQLESQRVSGTQPSLPLERYAGTYSDPMYGDFSVALEGGRLVAHFQSFTGPMEHWHYNTFRAVWQPPILGQSKPFLTFQLDATGKVAKVEVEGLATFKALGGAADR